MTNKKKKTYTAEEIHGRAVELIRQSGGESITASMLCQEADILERGDEALRALNDMQDNTDHLDIETVKDIVTHILRGAR